MNQRSQSYETQPTIEKGTKQPNYLLRRAGTIALVTGLLGAGYAGVEAVAPRTIGTTVETVNQGEGPIDTVGRATEELATTYNVDPSSIRDIVGAGQDIAGDIAKANAGNISAGEQVEVTLKSNLFSTWVEADLAKVAPVDIQLPTK